MVGYDPARNSSSLIGAPQEHLRRHACEVCNRNEPKHQSRAEDCKGAFHAIAIGSGRESARRRPVIILPK